VEIRVIRVRNFSRFYIRRSSERSRQFEIVYHNALADALEHFLDELNVHRMGLVIVLSLFVRKQQVQGDLVSLIDNRPMAGGHSTDMKTQHARNGP
jgi:hypothetical protein